MPGKTLHAKGVAQRIGVSRATFYNMLNSGRFPVAAVPGTKPRRWAVERVDAWLSGADA